MSSTAAIALTGDVLDVCRRDNGKHIVKIEIHNSQAVDHMFRVGHSVAVVLVNSESVAAQKESYKPFSDHYARLDDVQFFSAWSVLEAAGSDEEFLEWVKWQPCVVTKKKNHEDLIKEDANPVVAAHVRRVKHGAGTSKKPPYSAIPLTNALHQLQHNRGESAVVAQEKWDFYRDAHVTTWCKDRIATALGYENITQVPPDKFFIWAEEHGLSDLIAVNFFHA